MTLPRQQTPKPAAQVPSAVPDLVVHSLAVTQVPVREVLLLQASLGNWTTENRPTGLGRPDTREHRAGRQSK